MGRASKGAFSSFPPAFLSQHNEYPCKFVTPRFKYDITYMVASHLQGDIDGGEEGGCGLIFGLDRGRCPPAPMDFAARLLI